MSAIAVAAVANRKDSQRKLTRLNNNNSLWSGLRSLNVPDITYRSSHRVPPHIITTTSWESSINNAVIYAWGSKDEQARECAKYDAADKETKKQ